MIRFVDIKTGNTFDGSGQYIFWFEGEQSINLIYSQPICFISNKEYVKISIDKNNIFHLIDTSKITQEHNYHDIKLLKTNNELTVHGTRYSTYYVYMIYIIGSAEQPGEYTCNFYIDDEKYNIGADFYGAEESLYINLSNNGIEMPEAIQKAIYPVNVREDKQDNITLNRKWKELLSNYWDIVANKGSYKSLFNSLNWFEYGDVLRLCELWKYDNHGTRYEIQDIQSILKNKYEESRSNFAKTTYIAIYCSLEKIKTIDGDILYDDDKNPQLEKITYDWSVADLALKLSMLGNFYETYFMPIHLDLIHSTIENITFANTTTLATDAIVNRVDHIYHHEDIVCNVKDGDIYNLDVVECYVNPDTLFQLNGEWDRISGWVNDRLKNTMWDKDKYDLNGNLLQPPGTFRCFVKPENIIGVNRQSYIGASITQPNAGIEPPYLNRFMAQKYKEIGAIVDFEIITPLDNNYESREDKDFFKKEIIYIDSLTSPSGYSRRAIDYKIIKSNTIKFSILFIYAGTYKIKMQFETANGQVFTKTVSIIIKDTAHDELRICKIQHMSENNIRKIDCFTGEDIYGNNYNINNYIFTRVHNINRTGVKYTNYIPSLIHDVVKIPKLKIDPYSSFATGEGGKMTDEDKAKYRDYLYTCINDIDIDELMNIRESAVNDHHGVCTNHLLVFKCSISEKDSGQNTDFVFDNKYLDAELDDDGNEILENRKKYGPGGVKKLRVSLNEQANNNWKDCWDVINTWYDVKFIWKGSTHSGPTSGYLTYCDKLYAVCVSKLFNFNTDLLLYYLGKKNIDALEYFKYDCMPGDYSLVERSNTHLYDNKSIFIPCYHELVDLNANKIQDINLFTVTDDDALCVMATIEYSKSVSNILWEFINVSDPNKRSIKPGNIMQPFIAESTEKFLDPGYYSIKFQYKYGNKINTITLDSAFKKV